MKFALYYPWIYLHGGVERSMLELLERSRHDWIIYTGHYDESGAFPGFARHRVVKLNPLTVDRSISSVMRAALTILLEKVPIEGCDAIVVWCDGLGDLLTFRNRRLPIFNICSTPLRPAFDPVYAQQALQFRTGPSRLAFLAFRQMFRIVDRLAWRHYAGVIATSIEVKKRIVENGLYRESAHLRIYYPGIDWAAMQGETSLEPFLLAPGRIMWTKNLELAVAAFLRAGLPEPWRLVIAGFVDHKSGPYLAKLMKMASGSDRIEFVISPDDRQLEDLYRRASAILFPPLNEDWGIVPLEAMAYGKPVLANNSGGPRESVAQGVTGWLFEPDPEIWAAGMARMVTETGRLAQMSEKCRVHVQQYDWADFVRGIDNSFEEWMGEQAAKSRQ